MLPLFGIVAALASASPVSAFQAAAAPAPIYPGPGGAPHYLLGVTAAGSPADLDRLAAAATSEGWPTARDLASDGRVSLVIGFPGANVAQVDAFLKRAAAGEFGRFTFESTMAPVSAPAKR
jgi:hypothetical protein